MSGPTFIVGALTLASSSGYGIPWDGSLSGLSGVPSQIKQERRGSGLGSQIIDVSEANWTIQIPMQITGSSMDDVNDKISAIQNTLPRRAEDKITVEFKGIGATNSNFTFAYVGSHFKANLDWKWSKEFVSRNGILTLITAPYWRADIVTGSNLIVAGNMLTENMTSLEAGNTSGWGYFNGSVDPDMTVGTTEAYHGIYSMHYHGSVTPNRGVQSGFRSLTTGSSSVCGSGFARWNSGTTASLVISLLFGDSSDVSVGTSTGSILTGDSTAFREMTHSSTIPTGTKSVALAVHNSTQFATSADFYADTFVVNRGTSNISFEIPGVLSGQGTLSITGDKPTPLRAWLEARTNQNAQVPFNTIYLGMRPQHSDGATTLTQFTNDVLSDNPLTLSGTYETGFSVLSEDNIQKLKGRYAILARVKADSDATSISMRYKVGAVTTHFQIGSDTTIADSTDWQWVNMGESTIPPAGFDLSDVSAADFRFQLQAKTSSGTPTFWFDRLVLLPLDNAFYWTGDSNVTYTDEVLYLDTISDDGPQVGYSAATGGLRVPIWPGAVTDETTASDVSLSPQFVGYPGANDWVALIIPVDPTAQLNYANIKFEYFPRYDAPVA